MTVWNRSPDKASPLAEAGAKLAATPADLASQADVIITILTNHAAQNAVYDGPSGLLSGNAKGKLFIEMSTVQPHEEAALAERCGRRAASSWNVRRRNGRAGTAG